MNNKDLLKRLIEILELFEVYNKSSFEDLYNGLNINEVHTIDFIGRNKGSNLISLSKRLNITRGGVTKIVKRLEDKKYVELFTISNNKKEKYLRLTESGLDVFKIHEEIHEVSLERDSMLFERFSKDEKITIQKLFDSLESDLLEKLK